MKAKDIINYKHIFKIDNAEINILINYNNGYWSSKVIKGYTGITSNSGGNYNNLQEYIKEIEKEHRYFFRFFNK